MDIGYDNTFLVNLNKRPNQYTTLVWNSQCNDLLGEQMVFLSDCWCQDEKHAWQDVTFRIIYIHLPWCHSIFSVNMSLICLTKVNCEPEFCCPPSFTASVFPFPRRSWSTSLRFAAPTWSSAVATRSPTTALSTPSRRSGAHPSPACLR